MTKSKQPTEEKKPIGRPPGPPGTTKDVQFVLRTTAAVKARADELSKAAGVSRNVWIEGLILRAKK